MPKKVMTEPDVTLDVAKEHGLSEEEFHQIREYLGRMPTFTELGVYSVMWSEHCSYKNSILEIKKLPNEGPQLLVGAGEENAGLVDIGDGLGCVFKVESHNHPSAIEPYEGAATGVGGIHRDIFTMGARPVASLNSLRFGDLNSSRTQFLLDGVVRGIADYGNSFGVPVVGGEIYFDEKYEGNPLVNAMSVGIVKEGQTVSAIAEGPGNPVLIVGSSTGRDGIHGATFASEEISEESEDKRPSVQVGDPFTEKLLLEASLEAIKNGGIVGMQDMGAAGISCSSSEMSEKGQCGMRIDLDKVPVREKEMTAYEMLLSESQERMLIVAEKGREQELIDIYEKWDLNAVEIGTVTEDENVTYLRNGEIKADIPAESLVLGGGAPVYEREIRRPAYLDGVHNVNMKEINHPEDHNSILQKLLSSPNISSKRWVYEQYDTMVRTNTVNRPGATDSGVVRIKGTGKGLAVKTDCNGRYVYLNPERGGEIAVAEAARNIVCSGAKPLAITNCLNFGNPYDPQMYWCFKHALKGISAACRTFSTPVTGGNVSFYNENPENAVFPTPVIGMLGLVEDIENHLMTPGFKNQGDAIFYIGAERKELGGSEYLKAVHNTTAGDAPQLDLEFEARLQQSLLKMIQQRKVNAVHDISDGGLAVTLAEMAIFSGLGAKVDINSLGNDWHEVLYSEAQSGVVVTCQMEKADRLDRSFSKAQIPIHKLGKVEGYRLQIDGKVDLGVAEMEERYEATMPEAMED
jgi:phosphoribosylformylglycinamidine synthase